MDLLSTKLSETKQEREKRLADRNIEDVRALLALPAGRRYLWAKMASGGQFQDAFVQGMSDQTTYNLGKASLAREILNDIMIAEPSKYMQMQQEYASEQASFEALDKKLEKA